MANTEQLAIILEGVPAWNAWRVKYPDAKVDLRDANLREADLTGASLQETDLFDANLMAANLATANLYKADLRGAQLFRANLAGANLTGARLFYAQLMKADLRGANLTWACFRNAKLFRAILTKARLNETLFANTELGEAEGLGDCIHEGWCVVDHRTLEKSWPLPHVFLQGCGMPDRLVGALSAAFGNVGV